ncbi:hypothetical protein [Paraferrimonas sedimenticola]|uniref:Uncharacterized protein n=1 Tax=Paraferrimonas sedimenticola TaxID=375674 RepID=A0AA37RZ84_9GAMM|nr:hypothetical protein [Paraferrimonas sedimenticola]GLP97863.1 hypothetical protein GCM10007895_31700 [Paraferrimonas sedimenticola]
MKWPKIIPALLSSALVFSAYADHGLAFDSVSDLNRSFVDHNDVLSRVNIEQTLAKENFNRFINRMRVLSGSDNDFQREVGLTMHLGVFRSTMTYNEDLVCTGKVCALSINYITLDPQELRDFENFGGDFVFTRNMPNDDGSGKIRALFIASMDESRTY